MVEFFDEDEIRRAIRLFLRPGEVIEMRVLNSHVKTVSGYYCEPEALLRDAMIWSGKAPAVYVTMNPVLPDLLARSCNQVRRWARATTADPEIVRRAWFGIDFDPVRPAEISSTDEEHDAALERAQACREWLRGETAWADPVFADSGNGAHLLYPIDLPNSETARAGLERILGRVAQQWDDARVKVDTTTFNAARIWKLYGTLAAKGEDFTDPPLGLAPRPHRLARILELPQWIAQ